LDSKEKKAASRGEHERTTRAELRRGFDGIGKFVIIARNRRKLYNKIYKKIASTCVRLDPTSHRYL